MATVPTCEDLAGLFDNGTLAGEMARRFMLHDEAEMQVLKARCAELHNAGTRDLLQFVDSEAFQRLSGTEFFMATHFLCEILPQLEATPARMMTCVESLVTRGGADMAANQPNAAFRAWCTKDPRRARDVIAASRDGDDLAIRHLTFALEAIRAITEARQIALAYDHARRLSAVTALGRMGDDNPASRVETLAAFSSLLDSGADDNLRANMLDATAAIVAHSRDVPSPKAVDLVRRLVEDVGEFTLHQSARVLWAYRQAMHPDIVTSLLEALARLDPANKGTVNELDLGLTSLLNHGYDGAAIAYVTDLLSKANGSLELENLDSFIRELISGPSERLSRVVTRWLLLGAQRLCQGLSSALHSSDLRGPPLSLRAEDLAISPAAQIFLCRKAIGWFFVKPTTAASVLVSVLRVCDAETAPTVLKLLADPMLLNYSGVREYLNGLASDDVAKSRVDQALAENDAYLEAVRTVPSIKELQPSEHQRRIQWLRMSDFMRDVHKRAESKSVFFNFVKRSVLLYGNRSLSFIKEKDSLRPVEMDLKQYGVSFEMPRMETIDPVGLDHMLRVFRVEKMAP